MEEKIIKYFSELPIHKGNKKNPYVILFDALIGMGKSTVAKVISKLDDSVILNNDEARYDLNYYGDSTIIYELQHKRMIELLKNNNSCIIDCNFSNNRKQRLKQIYDLGYPVYVIRLECSEEIIKERILNRTVVVGDNYSTALYDEYLEMKNETTNIDDNLISFIINTEKNIEIQVEEFLNKYDLI